MQPIQFLGRLTIILLLISCVCSVLADAKDLHARKVKVSGAKPKAKPKVAAPKVKAKPKAKASAKAKPKPKPKPKTKTKAPAKAAPKTKAPAKAKPKAKAPTKAPAKAVPKTKAPAKATPKGKTAAKKPAPKNAAKSCPVPKKGNRPRAFETDEELDAYYGIVKRDFNTPAVAIRGRSIEKRTNVCGFHELRDQAEAERGCSANTARFVIDATTGNLVKQGQGRVPGVACDHIIELQLVADVMANTGACTAAERMLRAGGFQVGLAPSLSDKMKALIDKHIVPTVNGASNVIFLDSGVNQSKNTYVQKFKGTPTNTLPDGTATNTGADAAQIRTYLTDGTIRNQSLRSSVAIDTKIAKFLQAAKQEALKELKKRQDKAGAQCTETQQTKFATDESVISAEPANSKKANFPDTQALWAKISDL
ncbi:hypothetical protein PQX77_015383 [Marasmius sp. AFHP31]|nr:hypothetical protein PQX77_015383 [Marasmius sp. AFHP31]